MTKKNPDRRERARLKKIEDAKQSLRYRAVMMVKDGRSYRETAEVLGVSPQFVCDWSRRLLDCRLATVIVGNRARKVRVYSLKEDWRELIRTRTPGPRPGTCPKV